MEIAEILDKKFPSLYDKDLKDEIVKVGKLERVTAGNVILEMGTYIKSIPLVAEGSIKVMREDSEGNEILLSLAAWRPRFLLSQESSGAQ